MAAYSRTAFGTWLSEGRKRPLLWSIHLAAASAVTFGFLTAALIFNPDGPRHDYAAHINFAMKSLEDGENKTPHFLYQWLTISHHALLSLFNPSQTIIAGTNRPVRFDWGVAGWIVMVEIYVALALSMAWWLSAQFRRHVNYIGSAGYGLSFCLGIMSPIFVLAYFDGLYYLGYVPPSNLYIIPTQVLSKLTTFWLFAMSVFLFRENIGLLHMAALCLVTAACGFSKPNGLMVMLPGIWSVAALARFNRQSVNLAALSVLSATALAVLLWQYHFKFVDPTSPIYESTIIFTAPFDFYRHYSDYVPLKIGLSILFPLYVVIVYRREALSDFHVRIASIAFIAGLIMAGFLGESGEQRYSGNFTWSAQIGCFLFFVATTAFFFGRAVLGRKSWGPAEWSGIVLFALHVIAGVVYYLRSYTQPFT